MVQNLWYKVKIKWYVSDSLVTTDVIAQHITNNIKKTWLVRDISNNAFDDWEKYHNSDKHQETDLLLKQ